jgi:hypothetical protein
MEATAMSEYQLPKGWPERIRGAQRDLIKAAGGIERVAELLGRSVGHVGRWNNPGLDDLMPFPVILLLEDDTKLPVVTRVMAQMIHGRDLTEPDGRDSGRSDVLEKAADAMESAGGFAGDGFRAVADGDLTDAELMAMDRKAAETERDLAAFRQAVARRRAGLRLVRGG